MKHPLSSLVPTAARVLWVASSGGHFAQLKRIADASQAAPNSHWITFDTNQTRSVLDPSRVTYVDYIAPRDRKTAAKVAFQLRDVVRDGGYDMCLSTGAALAVSALPWAARYGLDTIYVESVTRVHGPSLSGRILAPLPRVRMFTQHERWSDATWAYRGSILDSWSSRLSGGRTTTRKIFVTLGTIKPYRFDRAVDAILRILEPSDEVIWQLGSTTRSDLPGTIFDAMSPGDMQAAINAADVVITHAGVGTVMELLDKGICPVIVVRNRRYDEHVDDHQVQIAAELLKRRLAVDLSLTSPSRESLTFAASTEIVKTHIQQDAHP